jgi:curli biogenesis system outer membrane secretion channel CsgG
MCLTSLFLIGFLAMPVSVPYAAPQQPSSQSSVSSVDGELGSKVLKVRRIYVESFGDDKTSKILQAMVINSLTASKRFIVTENKDKADAVLKGTAIEKTSQEVHATGERTAVAGAAEAISGSANRSSASVSGASVAHAAGIEDSQLSTETIDRAAVAVRLVAADGDLIWATTQESKGAKFKGASSDVADKVVRQLLHDIEKLEKDSPVSNKRP